MGNYQIRLFGNGLVGGLRRYGEASHDPQHARLPITDKQIPYASEVAEKLRAAGVRVSLDDRNEKVNLKIREAQLQKVPYMLVVGDREAEAGTVSVRHRKHADMGVKPLEQFVEDVCKLVESKSATE